MADLEWISTQRALVRQRLKATFNTLSDAMMAAARSVSKFGRAEKPCPHTPKHYRRSEMNK